MQYKSMVRSFSALVIDRNKLDSLKNEFYSKNLIQKLGPIIWKLLEMLMYWILDYLIRLIEFF